MRIETHVAVNALIPQGNKILLTRRSLAIREPHKWCLPGGHVECGEGWREAIRREVAEEIGLKILRASLVGVYSDPKLTVTENPVDDAIHAHFIVALYRIEEFSGVPTPNYEVDTWGWFGEFDLPSPMIRSHPIRIEDHFHKRTNVIR